MSILFPQPTIPSGSRPSVPVPPIQHSPFKKSDCKTFCKAANFVAGTSPLICSFSSSSIARAMSKKIVNNQEFCKKFFFCCCSEKKLKITRENFYVQFKLSMKWTCSPRDNVKGSTADDIVVCSSKAPCESKVRKFLLRLKRFFFLFVKSRIFFYIFEKSMIEENPGEVM